jgi:hypothetical protein
MPEIKNELPTDQELREYFMEHYGYLVDLLSHKDLDADSEPLRALRLLPGLGCEEFLSTSLESIFASLQRLNRLSRTDPFWNNTNKRPTVFKLDEFCRLILEEDPSDALALRTILAKSVLDCAASFNAQGWKRMIEAGQLEAPQVACAALCYALMGGESEGLVELLKEVQAVEDVRPMLEQFSASESELISEWATSVLAQAG